MLNKEVLHENISSAVSYGTGGFAFVVGSLPQIADTMQHIAIILGCIVVFIRLLHDGARFIYFLKNKKDAG